MPVPPAHWFVNREYEIRVVRSLLADIERGGGNGEKSLLNVFGIPGIGKSAFLKELCRQYSEQGDFFVLFMDLADVHRRDLRGAKLELLRLLGKKAVSTPVLDVLRPLTDLEESSDEKQLDQALERVATALCALSDCAIVLITDTWDAVPETLFAWFEHVLLLPVVTKQKRTLTLLGSQAPLRWRQYEVRRRVQKLELMPLEEKYIARQLAEFAQAQHVLFQLTHGHPLANTLVRDYLHEKEYSAVWLQDETHQAQAAQFLTDKIIEHVFGDRSAELEALLQVISLLREFDIHTLRTLLPKVFPDLDVRSQSVLTLTVRQLAEKHVISWSDTTRSYQLDTTLQAIIARALELNNPTLYNTIRSQASDYYRTLVEKAPGGRNQFLVEYFYQSIYKDDPPMYNTSDELLHTFLHYLDQYYRSRLTELERLRKVIAEDEGLREVLARRGLPPALFDDALQQFESQLHEQARTTNLSAISNDQEL